MALEQIIQTLTNKTAPAVHNLPNGARLHWWPATKLLAATRLEVRLPDAEQKTFEKYIRKAGWEPTNPKPTTDKDGLNDRYGIAWTLVQREPQAEAQAEPVQTSLF
jgi:hypothetical protein